MKEFVPRAVQQNTSADGTSFSPKGRSFDFPEGGWECSKCQNYNFKGREACYRCKKDKNGEDCEGKPKHMNVAKLAKKVKRTTKRSDKDTSSSVQNNLKDVNTSSEFGGSEDNERRFANKWAASPDYRHPKEKTNVTQ